VPQVRPGYFQTNHLCISIVALCVMTISDAHCTFKNFPVATNHIAAHFLYLYDLSPASARDGARPAPVRIHIGRERGTRTRGGHLVLRSFPRLVFIYFWLLRAWAVLVLGSGTSRSKSNLFFPFTHHMPFTFTVSIDHRRRLLACSVFWLLLRLLLLQC
jgi:hypothetical protein